MAADASADLEKSLDSLFDRDPSLARRLASAGFDRSRFASLAASLREGDPTQRRRTRNCVKGVVRAPEKGEILPFPEPGGADEKRLREKGEAAMRAGELAFCTMAGGMATRMGGIVKALADALPGSSFLGMRLRENETASKHAARPIPLWLMTSEATHEGITDALRAANAPPHVAAFMQNLSLRLNPDGSLFFDAEGNPSTYATGHGDLVDALRRSGLLVPFLAQGGKYVWITNVDNLGAAIDPVVLGRFVESAERGAVVQCEVCRKEGDKGGIPVHAEGKLQVLEEFRLPPDFDPTTVDVFNTNTFLVAALPLADQDLSWTYFEVEKKVGDKPAIQFERLLQELTAQMPSTYLEVPRDGASSRFLPVKDFDELAKRRANIEVVARARGMV